MSWRDRAVKAEDAAPQEVGGWRDRAVPETSPEMGKGKAALFGGLEGLSFGFGDELTGAGSAYTGIPGEGLAEKATSAIMSPEVRKKAVADYLETRNKAREGLRQAKEEEPGAFMAGEVAGSVPSMLIPGAGASKMARLAALAAAEGGVRGLGSSEADLTEGDVLGAARDTATGAGIGLASHGAMEGIVKPVGGFIKDVAVSKTGQALEHLSGLNPKLAQVMRREGPAVFEGTTGTPESSAAAIERIQDVINNARRTAGKAVGAEEKALGLPSTRKEKYHASLGPSGKMESLPSEQIVMQAEALLDTSGIQGKEAIPHILRLQEQIGRARDFGKRGIDRVSGVEDSYLGELYDALRDKLDDIAGPLQSARTKYSDVMGTVEGLEPKFSDVKKGISTVNTQLEEGLRAVDPEVKALGTLEGGDEAMRKARNEVARLRVETALPESANKGYAQMLAQQLGLNPQFAAKFLATVESGGSEFPTLKRAAVALSNAAKRGAAAVSTTHFLLQQQDDRYRQAMTALQEQGGDQ